MARPSSSDPLDKFRWTVSIEGFTRLGFTQCDVPSVKMRTRKYPEGGAHLTPRQIIDAIEYKPITFQRGVTADKSFNDWIKQVFEVIKGSIERKQRPGIVLPTETGGFEQQAATEEIYAPLSYRKDVEIRHLNREGNTVKLYKVFNAIPIEFVPASTFSSDGDDILSMEKLTLAYESFTVESIDTDNNPYDPRDVGKRLIRRAF